MTTTNHAERFIKMCDSFDRLFDTYVRTVPLRQSQNNYPPMDPNGLEPYIITHLCFFVDQHTMNKTQFTCRTESNPIIWHWVGPLTSQNDLRFTLPSTIRQALLDIDAEWDCTSKVELTWIICYLNGVMPDQNVPNWQFFECSHIVCISWCRNGPLKERKVPEQGSPYGYGCIDINCLRWESKSDNQSRGYQTCWKTSNHCGLNLCFCQGLHLPNCK